MDGLAQAVRAYQVGESGSVSLVRGNGSILVHRDPALVDGKHWLKDRPGFSTELSAALLNRERFAHAMYEAPSGRQLIASSYVPELDLYVIAELPEAQVLGGVRRTIALTSAVASAVPIPVIASGGAGKPEHFYEAFTKGRADAVLAASLFHFGEVGIPELKAYLASRKIPVRK